MKRSATVTAPIGLTWPLRSGLKAATRTLFALGDQFPADFLRPAGEATSLVSPDSESWRAFKNPLSLFIGGVAPVRVELAEPRLRTGVCRLDASRGNLPKDAWAHVKPTGALAVALVIVGFIAAMYELQERS